MGTRKIQSEAANERDRGDVQRQRGGLDGLKLVAADVDGRVDEADEKATERRALESAFWSKLHVIRGFSQKNHDSIGHNQAGASGKTRERLAISLLILHT